MTRTLLAALLMAAFAPPTRGQGTAADYERAARLPARFAGKVERDRVEPHWAADGESFWYKVELPGRAPEFVRIDAAKGERTVIAEKDVAPAPPGPKVPRRRPRPDPARPDSPDGRFTAFVEGHNLYLRDRKTEDEFAVTKEGTAADGYDGRVFWSPDSRKFVAVRRTAGTDRVVTLVESSPRNQLQPRASTYRYAKPGDPIPQPKPHLFALTGDADAPAREVPVPDALFANPWDISYERWTADSREFRFLYNQRGHGTARVVGVDAATGKPRAILTERPGTFFDYADKLYLDYQHGDKTLFWMSERSGYNHLYRVDAATGEAGPVTKGDWLVRGVERYDAESGTFTLRVMGLDPKQDPYHVHYATVKRDGTGFLHLTPGDGTHAAEFSPDRRYYLDSYSRVDMPPVTELRRTADAKLLCVVETADISHLKAAGWRAPERFAAKGRDGVTAIYGIIVRPTDFDPAKKYPVIEQIYAGPQDHHVPKAFTPDLGSMRSLAELGFVVVQIDGMGTNWRSKAFHDVCWKNLGDAGLPDRVLWIKAAAKRDPTLDLSRGVGIYGGSAGGQNALGALLTHGDFYTVAVADCGCHDNRMDKVWWNELWMGWPVGPHYAAQSNVTLAKNLKGKLLLVVGELDRNVDPASTLQVANALIKADKDFELLLIPGAGHGAAETPYGSRRRADWFVRHLLKVEPRR